jgi:hypothetical protein
VLQKELGNAVSVCVCFRTICHVVVNLYGKGKKNTYTKYVWYNATQITYYRAVVASMVIDNRIVMVLLKRSGLVLHRIT